jgi:hypothetical protein
MSAVRVIGCIHDEDPDQAIIDSLTPFGTVVHVKRHKTTWFKACYADCTFADPCSADLAVEHFERRLVYDYTVDKIQLSPEQKLLYEASLVPVATSPSKGWIVNVNGTESIFIDERAKSQFVRQQQRELCKYYIDRVMEIKDTCIIQSQQVKGVYTHHVGDFFYAYDELVMIEFVTRVVKPLLAGKLFNGVMYKAFENLGTLDWKYRHVSEKEVLYHSINQK